MEKVKSVSIAGKIIAEVLFGNKKIQSGYKSDRPLSQVKEIRAKIKELANELSKLLLEDDHWPLRLAS